MTSLIADKQCHTSCLNCDAKISITWLSTMAGKKKQKNISFYRWTIGAIHEQVLDNFSHATCIIIAF